MPLLVSGIVWVIIIVVLVLLVARLLRPRPFLGSPSIEERRQESMGIGTSIVLIALGAILAFGVVLDSNCREHHRSSGRPSVGY